MFFRQKPLLQAVPQMFRQRGGVRGHGKDPHPVVAGFSGVVQQMALLGIALDERSVLLVLEPGNDRTWLRLCASRSPCTSRSAHAVRLETT